MILTLVMIISLMPAVTINAAAIDEQFTLAPGGTYYFNLSSKLSDIQYQYDGTATINTALPDSSLKWVPFTYAGTVNAYSRAAAGISTDANVTVGPRSLFVSDYAVSANVSWDGLNGKGLIFGDAGGNYTANGINYNLRSLSVGSEGNGQSGDAVRGIPQSNEWDQVLNKNGSYIKYQNGIFCWGQDTLGTNESIRVGRSWGFVRYFGSNILTHRAGNDDGFRPALEILNAGILGSDGIKTVTYDMGTNGKIGSAAGGLTQAAVVYTGALTLPAVTEVNGFYYTGMVQEGMTLGWLSGDGDFYAAGTSLSSLPTGSTLTAGYGVTGVTVSPSPIEIERGASRQFTATVSGSGTYSHAVSWTAEGAVSGGTTINASGLLTVAADETASTLTVKAVSVQNGSKFGTAAVTVIITPTVSPTSRDYDLSAPADVTTAITWNSAASVTNVVYSVSPATTLYTLESDDYTVADDTLTIKNSFFSGLSIASGAALEFDITFNTGATAALTVNVVNSYTPPAFVPITGITGVPTAATAGVDLTLSGTVVPANATNQTIDWNVLSAGTTGATVSGNTLSATAAGTVTVRATITNGLTVSTDYTQDFTITVSTITYTITFNSGGSVYTTRNVDFGQSIESAAWPADPTRSSYTFGGWFTGENGAGTQFTSATPVNATATVYAKWTYSDAGGSSFGGGSSAPATSTYNAEFNAGNGSNAKLPVTVDKSSGNASVDAGTGSSLMSDGKTTIITVPAVPDVDTYTLGIPVPNLSKQDEQGALAFSTDTGTVTVPSNMLTGVAGISGSKAEISIAQGDKTSLPEDVKAAIGDKPLISLGLSIDGKQIGWSNPEAPVAVSIPYTPTAVELANPESIVIWYIDGSGNAVSIPNGHYDLAAGTVTFTTTHFSYYAVGYNKVSFNDVVDTAWYSDAVGFIAARDITTGTGNGCYSPDAKLTRGEFMVMMMRAYSIAPDESPTDNFADAGGTYYTGYLAAAKRLGVSVGVGNNMFAPDKEITCQEMFTLLYNALKTIGRLPEGSSGKTLTDFTDAGQIDSWAKDAMTLLVETGTVGGSGGKLSPTATPTRAEIAQVLYHLLAK